MIRKCTQRRERMNMKDNFGLLSFALSTLHGGLYGPSKKEGGDVLGSRPFPLQEMQLRRREKEEDTIWVRFPVPSADVIGKCFQKASTRRCFECTE